MTSRLITIGKALSIQNLVFPKTLARDFFKLFVFSPSYDELIKDKRDVSFVLFCFFFSLLLSRTFMGAELS